MTKSATEQAPRPWWRRLLCWLGLALGGLLALGVLLIVIVVAINWRDEALSPAAQAWLTEPANTVADADNAWLAMLAISYEHGNATTTGRKLVDTLRSNPRALEDEATTRQFGPRWSNQEISAEDCSIRRKGPGLLGRLLADPTAASVLVAAQRPALDRYYHAIALPGYHEIQLGDPLPSLITFKASCLARRDISLRLKNGDPTAIPLLEQHLHYWVTATTQSQSLLSLMIANAQMQADIDWLQDLRKAYPSRLPLPLKKNTKGIRRVCQPATPDTHGRAYQGGIPPCGQPAIRHFPGAEPGAR